MSQPTCEEHVMKWNTRDELVGRKVIVHTQIDETEVAEVLGVAPNGMLQVRTDSGKVMMGNDWEELAD